MKSTDNMSEERDTGCGDVTDVGGVTEAVAQVVALPGELVAGLHGALEVALVEPALLLEPGGVGGVLCQTKYAPCLPVPDRSLRLNLAVSKDLRRRL